MNERFSDLPRWKKRLCIGLPLLLLNIPLWAAFMGGEVDEGIRCVLDPSERHRQYTGIVYAQPDRGIAASSSRDARRTRFTAGQTGRLYSGTGHVTVGKNERTLRRVEQALLDVQVSVVGSVEARAARRWLDAREDFWMIEAGARFHCLERAGRDRSLLRIEILDGGLQGLVAQVESRFAVSNVEFTALESGEDPWRVEGDRDPLALQPGEAGVLHREVGTVPVFATREALDAFDSLWRLSTDDQELAIDQMAHGGALWAEFSGTKVRCVERYGFLRSFSEVVILEGARVTRRGYVHGHEAIDEADLATHEERAK
ncbi:MAG: hypothetical protein AAGI22_07745 [Planctomycetota bacterium]